ncbi:zinc finger protein CONSTANS-LIKE 6 [Cucurbita pepo subsp. pepo]|uniref:zinc finger protein CONSTANS-LIKE 6 n=1 Tax=Cucurbita pepo subsp. pepo TaxID=3664 RepID=UPI000C9D3166|nr:zinc finger protein CONSTANS-LIKE 6 [Cucurbita pepo subsp. pepo]
MLRSERKAAAEAAAAAAAMMGGRTARVCDACLCKRAHWFCAADDAFLCQACDVSVHSANQLARRHDRIRLETSSLKSIHQGQAQSQSQPHLPPWLKGFTRKARTPRPNKPISSTKASVFSLVPEISTDEGFSIDDNEDEHRQFHHHHHHHHQQVPVFDPLFDDEKFSLTHELDDFGDGFLPSEVDLAEFVANVENLLVGQEQEQEQEYDRTTMLKVKDEKEEEEEELVQDWNFKGEEIEEEEINKVEDEVKKKIKKKNIFLRLNYDAIITAWDTQSSPYTTGDRPEFELDDCWEEEWGLHENGERGGWRNDGEREARVSRYREKRRTRLFSKKIRYQVRKLNAEKRPRMKGRFVKRTATPSC